MFIFDNLPNRCTSNAPALIFSIGSTGNCKMMYLKQLPSVGNAFTNCFIRLSFVCSGGNIIFFLSASATCRLLVSPGLFSDLWDQFVSTQCFFRALLSQLYREKAGILCVSMLLTKKEAHHFKVNTDDPIVFVIMQ